MRLPIARLSSLAMLMMVAMSGPTSASERAVSAHDFTLTAITGEPMPLSQFAGKTLLVVNTASQCSFTDQYRPLQALQEKFRDRGLVVIGVPSNDFGGQEPGSPEDIVAFTQAEFRIDFKLADKTRIKGSDGHPFYRWAAAEAGPLGKPRWNFHKYLIGPNGQLVDWFSSRTDPLSDRLVSAIEATLPPAAGDNPS